MSEHTEPRLVWTRFAGLCALAHGLLYSWFIVPVNEPVLWFDGFVVACWMLGGNGRAALVDAIRNWKSK